MKKRDVKLILWLNGATLQLGQDISTCRQVVCVDSPSLGSGKFADFKWNRRENLLDRAPGVCLAIHWKPFASGGRGKGLVKYWEMKSNGLTGKAAGSTRPQVNCEPNKVSAKWIDKVCEHLWHLSGLRASTDGTDKNFERETTRQQKYMSVFAAIQTGSSRNCGAIAFGHITGFRFKEFRFNRHPTDSSFGRWSFSFRLFSLGSAMHSSPFCPYGNVGSCFLFFLAIPAPGFVLKPR